MSVSYEIPDTMTVIQIAEFGGPEVLKPAKRPTPVPGADEVLVKTAAVGVNFPDTMQRKGAYPPPPGTTDIPGLELAGTVVAVGSGVTECAPGDEVCALVSGGAYAEYCVVPTATALPLPKGYDMLKAAENFFTVWTNLFDGVHLTAGDTILIHGGSGGIGTAAIQVAKALGAMVFTTARNAEKCKACEELGATRAINYTEEDFVEVVKHRLFGRDGYGRRRLFQPEPRSPCARWPHGAGRGTERRQGRTVHTDHHGQADSLHRIHAAPEDDRTKRGGREGGVRESLAVIRKRRYQASDF